VGRGLFKLYRYTEGALKSVLFQKFDSTQEYRSHAWLSGERMIAGACIPQIPQAPLFFFCLAFFFCFLYVSSFCLFSF
jgi:hypothetical protein